MINLTVLIAQLSAIDNLQQVFENYADQLNYWYNQLSEVTAPFINKFSKIMSTNCLNIKI